MAAPTCVLDGGNGFDYARYFGSPTGLTVSLADPSKNTGDAKGDSYISIEGLWGSQFNDLLIGSAGDNSLKAAMAPTSSTAAPATTRRRISARRP